MLCRFALGAIESYKPATTVDKSEQSVFHISDSPMKRLLPKKDVGKGICYSPILHL